MISHSMRILAALSVTLGLAASAAVAAPLTDTPDNRDKVAAAAARLFSPAGVTPDMIEQTELCRIIVGGTRRFNLTVLDDISIIGLSDLPSGRGSQTDDAMFGGYSMNLSDQFFCGVSSKRCDSHFSISKIGPQDYAIMYGAVGEIVKICNPKAQYKPCPGGIFKGFMCAR